jgi:hypothetical protein
VSISLTRVFLPLVLLLAFFVRWEPTRTLRLAPDERDLGASRWLVDDPDTCQHLRRIELAIATDKVVSFDRFVNFPDGGEIPAMPLFDTVVAGIAQRFLRSPAGDVALGQVDEADLEDLAIKLSPILGLLMVLATWIAARNIVSGPRGDAAALLAAAIVALHPSCVAITSAGALAPMALAAILFALTMRSVVRCVAAEAMPGALLDAMVGGALAGMTCTCTTLGIVLFAPAWIALFLRVVKTGGDERAKALRAGLLFCLVAAFIARMPLNEGPWEASFGVMRGFASGVSMLLFLSTAPFIVMLLFAREEKQRAFRTLCFVAGLILMAWQLPQLWRDVSPLVHWLSGNLQLVQEVAPLVDTSFMELGTLLAAAGIAIAWVWHDRAGAATTTLVIFTSVTAVLATCVSRAIPIAVIAVACTLGRGVDMAWASADPKQRKAALQITLFAPALLLLSVISVWRRESDPSLREERIELVAGLRWMRANTESGGPWNSPRSPGSWGVMSPIDCGALVQYHARRPALVSPWSVLSGPQQVEAACQSWLPDPDRLARYVDGQRGQYVVTTWRDSRTRKDSAIAMRSLGVHERGGTELWGLDPSGEQLGAHVAAFELVHVSRRRVDTNGHADLTNGQPVVEIWRLDPTHREPIRARMVPR